MTDKIGLTESNALQAGCTGHDMKPFHALLKRFCTTLYTLLKLLVPSLTSVLVAGAMHSLLMMQPFRKTLLDLFRAALNAQFESVAGLVSCPA